MSQLPFPSYNPTASPVQSAVIPFQASVPQQVEIGAGTSELGAAFSQFSQTLASFAANRISENRAKAVADGELKAMKSRKTFRQLVESGEIKPEENPWEALGAASADGVMSAQRFRDGLRTKYDDKVAKDPQFGLSVSAVEDFVNREVQDAMSAGMQNPVWQRSFMKEVTPYISSLSENHASNVATFRRKRMNEALTVGITADMELFRAESFKPGVTDEQKQTLSKQALSGIQSRLDEAYQIYGPNGLDHGYKTLVDLEIASGSDPEIMAIIGSLKSGTGLATKTEQYRAYRAEKADDIERAQLSRDVRLGTDFYLRGVAEGTAPSEEEFRAHVKKNIRPDMSSTDISALYGDVSKKSESYRGEIVKANRNAIVASFSSNIQEAIANPSSKNASLWKDPEYLKAQIRKQEIDLRHRLRLSVDSMDVDKSVESLMGQLKFEASMSIAERTRGLEPQQQAQIQVAAAASLGGKPATVSSINDAVVAFQRNPSKESISSTLLLGLYTYQEAKRQNVPLASIGMDHLEKFYAGMEAQIAGGSTVEAAAYFSSQSTPASTPERKSLNDPKIRQALINSSDGLLTWRSTATGQVDALITRYLDWAATNPATQLWTPEDHGTQFVRWSQSKAVQTSHGWTVLPDSAPQSLRGPDAIELIESEITKAFQSTNSAVTGVRLVLGRNDQFQVFVTSELYPNGEFPDEKMSQALRDKYGLSDNFSARELDEVYRSKMLLEQSRIQQELRRQAAERNRNRPVWNGTGYGYQHGYAGYIPASESQMTPGMREAVKRAQDR